MRERQSASGDPLPYLRRRRFARASTLRFLYQADLNGAWTIDADNLALFWEQVAELDDALSPDAVGDARAFAETLIAGVIGKRAELDARLSAAADNWSLERMGLVERNILRLAAYEILCGDGSVPPLAALNEAIELAKEFGDKDSPRFVNGILDQLVSRK